MANDLNLCQFIGRLGQDPKTTYMPNGNAVANISIAVGEQWRDKAGEKQERTTWVNVVAFGKLAEIMAQYTSRGSRIYLSGSLRTRQWEKDGQKHYTTEIVAKEMQMLGVRPEADRKVVDPAESRAYREASGGSTKPAAPLDPFDDFEDPFG